MANAIPSSARNPGPWHLAKDPSDKCLYVADIHGRRVAFPYGPISNARLIAAAPDLLEACRGICAMIYRDKNGDERIDLDQYEEAERQCRRAIAKAQGRA
jgi:hypothetical protein